MASTPWCCPRPPMSDRPMQTSTRRPPPLPGAMAPGSPTAIWSGAISASPPSPCRWEPWPISACRSASPLPARPMTMRDCCAWPATSNAPRSAAPARRARRNLTTMCFQAVLPEPATARCQRSRSRLPPRRGLRRSGRDRHHARTARRGRRNGQHPGACQRRGRRAAAKRCAPQRACPHSGRRASALPQRLAWLLRFDRDGGGAAGGWAHRWRLCGHRRDKMSAGH